MMAVEPKKISADECLQPDAAGAAVWGDRIPSDAPSAEPEADPATTPAPEASDPDPTRFGDWEKKGRCVDF